MERLNEREQELACVARDLFLKGSPEYRVAKYALDNHFSEQQFINFIKKLPFLDETIKSTIHNNFRDISKDFSSDYAVKAGKDISDVLRELKKNHA
jgi:hypothetical protein